MEFLNSHFVESTIRDDKGIKGAIFVDSILIREAELPYGNSTNLIPKETIKDKSFLETLNGILVFKEHPDEMVNRDNYNELASKSIGSIVNAEYRETDEGNIVYGTLRITNPNMIEEVKNKRIKGGSLGYLANTELKDGKITQVGIKPNHFCLTHYPRDKGVVIFNSIPRKGEIMDKQEVLDIVNSALQSFEAKAIKNSQVVEIPQEKFNGFMQTIGSKIKDESVKAIFNSKDGLAKLDFIDNALSLKDIFNSEELDKAEGKAEAQAEDIEKDKKELEEYEKEIEALKKENSLLKSKLNSAEADEESKENESDKAEDGESVKDNSTDSSEKGEEETAKQNSVVTLATAKEVKNSNVVDSKYAQIANAINL